MKARKKNSNDEWQDVDYVQLVNSYVITKADQMEFQDTLSTELKTYAQITSETQTQDNWQDVRERAAIAAMHAIINGEFEDSEDPKGVAEGAIEYADALVEQLKNVKQ